MSLKQRIEKLEQLQNPQTLIIVRYDNQGRYYYDEQVYQSLEQASSDIEALFDNPLIITMHEAV